MTREVLFVSKPVAPPWNDSSKNLVRDVALGLTRYDPVVMGRGDALLDLPRGRAEPTYARRGAYAPALADQVRVLRRLLLGRRASLWHFFFAPNRRTSQVASASARLRRVPTVQTVCSAPAAGVDPRPLLFADRTVVLSKHTERRLLEAGVAPDRLDRVPAALEPLTPPAEEERAAARDELGLPASAPLVVYPGDLEFGRGASVTLAGFAGADAAEARLVMACRPKTDRAAEAESRLRAEAVELGIADRVRWLGETASIHALLGAADLVVLPSDTLYAKMDHPLVLLEAMSLERPVVVARGTPAEELAEEGGAVAIDPEAEALAAEIGRLLDDGQARADLGRDGRAHVLSHHGRRVVARRYEALYDQVLR